METETQIQESRYKINKLENWAFRIFVAVLFLAPIAFLPSNYLSLDLVKMMVIVFGVFISAGLFLFDSIKSQSFILPPKRILWSSVAVLIVTLISAFLSKVYCASIFGLGTEIYTFTFIFTLFLGSYIAYLSIVHIPKRLIIVYLALVIPFLILVALLLIRLVFGPSVLTLGILSNLTSTLLGSWFALGAYALIVAVILISGLVYLPLTRGMKIFYGLTTLIAFAVLFVVGFSNLWNTSSIVFFILTLVTVLLKKKNMNGIRTWLTNIIWLPILALVISVIFSWQGNVISGSTISNMGLSYSELSLPWQMTLDIGSGVVKNSPYFGVGPNQFGRSYIEYKPTIVNSTGAWSTEFTSGSGYFPTIFSTGGIFGLVAWIILFIFIGIASTRILLKLPEDHFLRFGIISSILSLFAGLLILFVTVQPSPILIIIFSMLGISFGISNGIAGQNLQKIFVTKSWKSNLCILLALIILGGGLVMYTKNFIAYGYFNRGIERLNDNNNVKNIDLADQDISQSLKLYNNDLYWRSRVAVGITSIQQMVYKIGTTTDASTTDKLAKDITNKIDTLVTYANNAVTVDPTNYLNYLYLARVYNLGSQLKIKNANQSAIEQYGKAISYNRLNPAIYLEVAQLQINNNDLADAILTLKLSLNIKNDYYDALSLLLQIYVSQNDIKNALDVAKATVQINPDNTFALYQLGVLLYTTNDYANAITVLERAVKLQPNYANAEYFLGLTYARVNRISDALVQFENIEKSNPDNQDVAYIINSLKSGKSLFEQPQAEKVAKTSAKIRKTPIK